MPVYEYFCRPCGVQFEVLRPMSEMDQPADCPNGHRTDNRVLSLFATPRGATSEALAEDAAAGGACCAGGCACGAGR